MLSLRVYTVYITKCKKPARYLSEPTFFSGTWTHGSSGSTAPYGFYYFVSSADSVHHCDFKQFSVAFILMLLFIKTLRGGEMAWVQTYFLTCLRILGARDD